MKIILDCNIWISFLIGHQANLIQRILTDMRFDVYACDELLDLQQHKQTKMLKLSDFKKLFEN